MAYWQVRAKFNNESYIPKFVTEKEWKLLSEKHKKHKTFESIINSIQEGEILFLADGKIITHYARCIKNLLDGIHIKVDQWKKIDISIDSLTRGNYIKSISNIKNNKKIDELLGSIDLGLSKIKKIKIQNFRLFKEFEMSFNEDINVIIADNGAGKTTILDAIATGYGAMLTRFPNVQGVSFKKQDLHINNTNKQEPYIKIELQSTQNCFWDRVGRRDKTVKYTSYGLKELNHVVDSIIRKKNDNRDYQMPLIIYYPSNRGVLNPDTQENSLRKKSFSRFSSLDGALFANSKFNHLFDWFYYMQKLEESKIIEKRDFDFKLPELTELKRAIESMLPQYQNPKIKIQRGNKSVIFTIEKKEDNGVIKELEIEQLSAGYKAVLAMVMDISARMSEANPHLGNKSEAIILIDELDLHLHPKWQQTILSDLQKTFPNAQFIVTTHSPQILTTVKKEQVFILEDNQLKKPFNTVYAKRSVVALEDLMGIDSKPPLEEAKLLDEYLDKIHQGEIDSEEVLRLRKELNELYGEGYQQLRIADMIINKYKALKRSK